MEEQTSIAKNLKRIADTLDNIHNLLCNETRESEKIREKLEHGAGRTFP